MTLKELKKHFRVYKWEDYYLLHSLTETGGRMNHKYIGKVFKKGNSFFVEGYRPTQFLHKLKLQLIDYKNSLPYDLEYYYPLYQEKSVLEMFIYDLLSKNNFKRQGYSDSFKLDRGSIYGYNATNIEITFSIDEEVSINLWREQGSWINVKCSSDFTSIERAFESLLKPLLLSEGVENIKGAEKMKESKVNIVLKELQGLDVNSQSINTVLKDKLLSLVQTL